MVNINLIQPMAREQQIPVMPMHQLTVKAKSKVFNIGESVSCYVQKLKNAWDPEENKFGVFPTRWSDYRYEVFTEQELHETFDEKL
jgi:hypothetical protein